MMTSLPALFLLLTICFAAVVVAVCVAAQDVPNIPLHNAAVQGLTLPAIGLGTGGYGTNRSVGYNGYPECWAEVFGCGAFTATAVDAWLLNGGVRIDSANSYANMASTGLGMRQSKVPREDIFLLSKIGPSLPLGYQDALNQFAEIKSSMQVDYVDLLLIHWPNQTSTASTDASCRYGQASYNATTCRLNTWKALVEIFEAGGAKAIGVSNFNQTHIQEIIDSGMPLPAANQCPFHLYNAASQMDLVRFCQAHNITFIGYSPLGIPDWHSFPPALPSSTPINNPTVMAMAQKYNKTAAQVLINFAWAHGIPVNPRSMNEVHMLDNMNAYDFELSSSDVATLLNMPQDYCKVDPSFYECVADGKERGPRPKPLSEYFAV